MIMRFATAATTCSIARGGRTTVGFGEAYALAGFDFSQHRHRRRLAHVSPRRGSERDYGRVGVAAAGAGLGLSARHAPQPAWGDPKAGPVEEILELRRRHFDDVFQPVVEGDAVFFGSSANHKVYCLDANTGAIRWTKITGGPVRLAPTLSGGRVYVASDDGFVYCLNAQQGQEIWKLRAAPEDRRVLGHGKMISLWPCRTGVLVDSGLAYFGAGIFPAERVFLNAVKADDGTLVWKNDTTGERPQSRISPQGYMLASPTHDLRADGARAARRVRSPGRPAAVRDVLRQERRRHLRAAGRRTRLHGHRTDGRVRPADEGPVRFVPGGR